MFPIHLRAAVLAACAGTILLSDTARAQLHTFSAPVPAFNSYFGKPYGISDINGDSVPDILINAPGLNGLTGSGYVFSGSDYSLLRTITPTSPAGTGTAFGSFASQARDLGGSSAKEIYITAPGEAVGAVSGAGVTYVVDAASTTILEKIESPSPAENGSFGYAVQVQDQNSDTIPDLVVGAPGEGAGGRFYLLSGSDHSVLETVNSPNAVSGGRFGAPTVIPDLNSDGSDDLIITAFGETVSGLASAGRVYVYSGATRALLYSALSSPNAQEQGQFGGVVSVIADVDSDGKSDFVVSTLESAGASYSGRCYLYSGDDGSLLHTFNPPAPTFAAFFGHGAVSIPDQNGDLVREIAIGQGGASGFYIFSGADRTVLGSVTTGQFESSSVPYAAADLDGDGLSELAIADLNSGIMYLYGSTPNLTLSPSTLNLGIRSPAAPTSASLTLTLRNTGLTALELTGSVASVTGPDAGNFGIGWPAAATTLPFNGTTTIGVEFLPSSEGAKSAVLNVTSSDPDSPVTTAALQGTGYTIPSGGSQGTAYIAAGTVVYGVDLSSGDRYVLTGPNNGSGPSYGQALGVAVENESTLVVAGSNGLVRVDRLTGDRTALSTEPYPFFTAPRGLAGENASSMVMALSSTGCGRVSLSSGGITIVSDTHGTGTGPSFFTPFAIEVEDNGTIVVGDVSGARLVRVDPAAGNRTVFTDGTCPPPYGVAKTSTGDFVVTSNGNQIYFVSGTTGAASAISGSGPSFQSPRTVDVTPDNRVYVYDAGLEAVVQVDLGTGERTIVSSANPSFPVGSGPDLEVFLTFETPLHMAVATDSLTAAEKDWVLYE